MAPFLRAATARRWLRFAGRRSWRTVEAARQGLRRVRSGHRHNFALQLLESRVCVGWHWLGYQDMIPREGRPSDDNIGIVGADYEAYQPLAKGMAATNRLAYHLADRWG